MFDYGEEFRRRVEQFAMYLKKMYTRSHDEVGGNCFMIFDEDSSDNPSASNALSAVATPELELVEAAFDDASFSSNSLNDETITMELPDEGWKEDDSQHRFIQFSFNENWFCMDMPLTALYRIEAEKILESRNGFFYVRDRPQFELNGDDVDQFEPFRKIYVYGDEESAAEDMAFIVSKMGLKPSPSRRNL